MTESKVYDSISKDVIEMFQEIEGCSNSLEDLGVSALGMRSIKIESHISKLHKSIIVNACDLKQEKALELFSVLEYHRVGAEMSRVTKMVPRNKHYEKLLIKFKEIEWLNIPIEKLNFKEEMAETSIPMYR